jgi:hypothetical protein
MPRIKYLDDNYGRVKKSRKEEERIAEEMGGKRLPRSGGMRWSKWDKKTAKGDIGTPDFHIEHKETEKQSISIKKAWLEKVTEGARDAMKDPALVVTFIEGRKRDDWAMIRLADLKRLLSAAEVSDDDDGSGD